MKKLLSLLLVVVVLQAPLFAQDFVLNNPSIAPAPGIYPGGTENVTFDFYVSGAPFTFSSNPLSNNFATVTFSFTKLNPTSVAPTGTGAALFTWQLSNNGGSGSNLVYTWTGSTKSVTMLQSPPQPKYHITFTSVPITYASTASQSDVRVAGQFTDPGAAPGGNTANNFAVIATYTCTSCGPTPINLLNFYAVKQNTTVLLSWQTTSEINSKNFEVQFSKDAVNWTTIGTIAAAGTSSTPKNYSMVHTSPVNGTNYYRLKQNDLDNATSFSATRVVLFSSTIGIKILPNPVTNKLYITSNTGTTLQSVVLYSAEGKQISNFANFIPGNSIDMSSLSSGTYMLKITDSQGNTEVKSVFKKAGF